MKARHATVIGASLALALTPLVAPAATAADTTLGALFTPVASSCGGYTYVQTGSIGDRYRVATSGVVTLWRFLPATDLPATVGLRIFRPTGTAHSYSVVGASATVSPSTTDLVDEPTRIPVRAGDLLGISAQGGSANCARSASAAYTYDYIAGDPTSGTVTGTASSLVQLVIAVRLETDADADGFGDTSQDSCPTNAATQSTCPASVPDRAAPETGIASVVAKKATNPRKKASVTMTFAANEASTYDCAVDSPVFRACASPYVVKLKAGSHTLAVRAIDTAGNVDRSAAVTSVRVKVANSRK